MTVPKSINRWPYRAF